MLWVAIWNGSAVTRWNPKTGKLLEIVNVPATHTTSYVFGGDDLHELYIPSARIGLKERILAKESYTGGLFVVNTQSKRSSNICLWRVSRVFHAMSSYLYLY